MIQHPNPTDDPEMEQFIDWLTTEGHESCSMSFQRLKEVWLKGMCQEMLDRLTYDRLPHPEWENTVKCHRALQEQVCQFNLRRDLDAANEEAAADEIPLVGDDADAEQEAGNRP